MKKVHIIIFKVLKSYFILEKSFVIKKHYSVVLDQIMLKNRGRYYAQVKRNGKILVHAKGTLGLSSTFGNRGVSARIYLRDLKNDKTEVKFKSRPLIVLILLPIGISLAVFFKIKNNGLEGLVWLSFYVINLVFWVLFRYQETMLLDHFYDSIKQRKKPKHVPLGQKF